MKGTGAPETVNSKVKYEVLGVGVGAGIHQLMGHLCGTTPHRKSHVLVALCIVYQCRKLTTLSQFHQDFWFIYIPGS